MKKLTRRLRRLRIFLIVLAVAANFVAIAIGNAELLLFSVATGAFFIQGRWPRKRHR